MTGYTALYKSKGGHRILVKTLTPQPDVRKFRVPGGIRTFKKVKEKQQLQEIIIMAKAAKAKKGKKNTDVTDDELEELETIEDIDDLEDLEEEDEVDEDEDEDEDEPEDEADDDDDEDEEEEVVAEKPKKKKKASQASKNGFVGTQEVAEYCGVNSRELRMVLRSLRKKDDTFVPDEETGRYQWKSLKDPQIKKIKKAIDAGAAKEIRDEALQKLKDKKAAEKAGKDAKKNTSSTKGKKKGKKKKVVEEDDE